jgi:hypothetical protein
MKEKELIEKIRKELDNRYGADKVSIQFLVCDLQELCENSFSGILKRQLEDLYNDTENADEKLSGDIKVTFEEDLAAVEETLKVISELPK